MARIAKKQKFEVSYKEELFLLWYRSGKPSPYIFHKRIPPDAEGRIPTQVSLLTWMKDWQKRAEALDNEVREQIESRMVQEKVEMLTRHAGIGVEMQDTAIEFIRNNKDKLTSSTAVRMLVEGIQIEQGSRGVSTALTKMLDKTDEDLINEVMALLEKSTVDIQEIKDEEIMPIDNTVLVE